MVSLAGYKLDRGYHYATTFTTNTGFGDIFKNIQRRLGPSPVRILTIGTGKGNLERDLKIKFQDRVAITSVEINPANIAKENMPFFQLITGPFEEVKVNGQFDVILSIYGTAQIARSSQPKAVEKIWELLAIQGEAFFDLNPLAALPAFHLLIESGIGLRILQEKGMVLRSHIPGFVLTEGADLVMQIYLQKENKLDFSGSLISEVLKEAKSRPQGGKEISPFPFRLSRATGWIFDQPFPSKSTIYEKLIAYIKGIYPNYNMYRQSGVRLYLAREEINSDLIRESLEYICDQELTRIFNKFKELESAKSFLKRLKNFLLGCRINLKKAFLKAIKSNDQKQMTDCFKKIEFLFPDIDVYELEKKISLLADLISLSLEDLILRFRQYVKKEDGKTSNNLIYENIIYRIAEKVDYPSYKDSVRFFQSIYNGIFRGIPLDEVFGISEVDDDIWNLLTSSNNY